MQGASGPEAGVWVIAETKDLPTNFIKIVVTDDQGRFMLPELPSAIYSVFVRGYGIVDSERQVMKPAIAPVTLRVSPAKTPQEAAKVYPGNYWLSMLEPPAPSEFPGTGPQGNGLGPNMQSQNHWINSLKSDCNFCHQLGNQLTRSVDHILKAKPELKTHAEAWEWRLGTGVRGTSMYGVLNNQGQTRSLKVYADWTERVAKGEVPPAPPQTHRHRAQPGADALGRRRRSLLHARSRVDRQESPDGESERCGLCRIRGTRVARRSQSAHELDGGARDSDACAARTGAVALPGTEPPVTALGQRAPVGESAFQPGRPAQPDARQQGSRVDDVEDQAECQRSLVL